MMFGGTFWHMKVDGLVISKLVFNNISFQMEFWKIGEKEVLEGFIFLNCLSLSFLISFVLKKKEQVSSLDFVIVHNKRKIIFSVQRTKAC